MQTDFFGFQPPFSNSVLTGPAGRPESAACGYGTGGNGSQSAGDNRFSAIIACLLGEPLQTGSCAPVAETTVSSPGGTAVADLAEQDTLLLQQAVTEIGLDPEYLKNLVAVAESAAGSEPWQSLQTLLETLALKLQQSEEPMSFSRLQAISTVMARVAELFPSRLETSDSPPPATAHTTGTVQRPASSESVLAGFVGQLNELLAAVRSASGSSTGLKQAAAIMTETSRADTLGAQSFSQSSDAPDPRSAGAATRLENPGNTVLQQQMVWAHEKPRLQTQAASLGGNPVATATSEAEGPAVLTRTPDKPVDDPVTRGSKQPLPPATAAVDPPSSAAGSNAELKTPRVADPTSGQDRPSVERTQPVIEQTRSEVVDLKVPEGFGWSQSTGDRSAESAPTSRVDPQPREALQSQALQQIIQKASVHLGNGQNEVKIELKPEFLGHIRMQIVTENHQVTLRVLTEFPFVKELIEHNIQHLRTELQQHGLKMDALNVSVANDSQASAGGQGHTPRSKTGFRAGPAGSGELQSANEKTAVTPAAARRSGGSAIDYFI